MAAARSRDSGKKTTQGNSDPSFSSNTATRSIAENSAASTNIGAAVTGTDPESDTLTYSLSGTDASKFDIGSTSGQITVKSGNIPNYEAKTSYSVTVGVSDKKNADGTADTVVDDTIAVTINVTDVNEPPPKQGAPTVAANATTPDTKLDVSWTAPTMTGKPAVSDYDVQYRLSGVSTWTDASFTGTGVSTTLSGLTKGKSYEVQVRAVNAEGNGAWSDSGSAITDANAVTRSVAENSAAGTNVGTAVSATANASYTYTYSLDGTDKSKFSIASSTGQITVGTGTSLDYETKSSYSVTVKVDVAAKTQGANAQSLDPNAPGDYTIPVTINVTDVNEPPAFSDDTATRSVAENTAAGTNVGAAIIAGADPEGDTLTYSLSGTDAAKFDIGSSTGQISVKAGNIPNYEAKTSYSVTVNVTDKKKADGTADTAIDDTIAVTIDVTDVNEPPPKPGAPTASRPPSNYHSSFNLSWTAPTMTGKPAVTGYDVQYKKVGESIWTDFAHTGTTTTAAITGLTGGTPYSVQVRAVNDEGDGQWSNTSWITDPVPAPRSIAENSAAGSSVGAPVTENIQMADYYASMRLDGTDKDRFDIDSDTGQIKVKTGNVPDYEAKSSYSVEVHVDAVQTNGASTRPLGVHHIRAHKRYGRGRDAGVRGSLYYAQRGREHAGQRQPGRGSGRRGPGRRGVDVQPGWNGRRKLRHRRRQRPDKDEGRARLRGEVFVQRDGAGDGRQRRVGQCGQHDRRHHSGGHQRGGRERAAERAGRSQGVAALAHTQDRARRQLDRAGHDGPAAHHGLRHPVQEERELHLERLDAHGNGRHRQADGAGRGHEVRRAGARGEPRGRERVVGHQQRDDPGQERTL